MISIVIVNFNTKDLLRTCLRTVRRGEPRAEVIVVDNASKDDSAEMVRKEFPKVRLIANRRNRGFAAANNQGFKVAKGGTIAMLNSDTEIPKGGLSELARYLEKHPETGVVAPQLRNPDGAVQQSASWRSIGIPTLFLDYSLLNRLLYKVFPTRRFPGKHLLTRWELTKTQTVGDLLGACLVFRKSLLDEIGQLDERFFIFIEETDFNLRVRDAGYDLIYYPKVKVLHHWGASIDSAGSLRRRFGFYYPSLYKFFRKRYGSLYVWLAKLLALLVLPVSLLLMLIFGIVLPPARRQLPVLWGALGWHWGIR